MLTIESAGLFNFCEHYSALAKQKGLFGLFLSLSCFVFYLPAATAAQDFLGSVAREARDGSARGAFGTVAREARERSGGAATGGGTQPAQTPT